VGKEVELNTVLPQGLVTLLLRARSVDLVNEGTVELSTVLSWGLMTLPLRVRSVDLVNEGNS